ncbi:MAG TPA: nitrophenyl compound nitroreductase subunit ArsF family protein [Candidatus Sumerlaeota bacterium]|nr:nitrophenyl compound nitroreductase subunit ArsF family protein [Candidatus Sumerlaeota bacterium]
MKFKGILTLALLCIVAASVAFTIMKDSGMNSDSEKPVGQSVAGADVKEPGTETAPVTGDAPPAAANDAGLSSPKSRKIIVYYFHGDVRCVTCRKIEALAHDTLDSAFKAEQDSGLVEWKTVNVDQKGNDHYVNTYQLTTRSIVVSEITGESETRWKNLDQIWTKIRDENEFGNYIQSEVRMWLEGSLQ